MPDVLAETLRDYRKAQLGTAYAARFADLYHCFICIDTGPT